RSTKGNARSPNTTPNSNLNGRSRSQIMTIPLCSGSTRGSLQEFRCFELVGGPPRVVWRQVGDCLVGDRLVEAFGHSVPAGEPLGLRESEKHAESNEQHEHEDGARRKPLQKTYDNLNHVTDHAASPVPRLIPVGGTW